MLSKASAIVLHHNDSLGDMTPNLGEGGGGMGYQGQLAGASLTLELDVWMNQGLGDPCSNHISWHSRGPRKANTAAHSASMSHTSNIPYLSDGLPHRVRVRYDTRLEEHHFSTLHPASVPPTRFGAHVTRPQQFQCLERWTDVITFRQRKPQSADKLQV